MMILHGLSLGWPAGRRHMIRGQMVVRRGSADDTFILLIYCFVLKFPSLNLGLQAALLIKPYQPQLPVVTASGWRSPGQV